MKAVPHSEEAELDLLGACMIYADVAERVVAELSSEEFYFPRNQVVHRALTKLVRAGHSTDAVSVRAVVEELGHEVEPAWLVGLTANTTGKAAVSRRLADIVDRATRRRLLEGTQRLAISGADPRVPLTTVIDEAKHVVANLAVPVTAVEPAPDIDQFLAKADEAYDWVVPGLLERGDRLILTGGEGLGKSTFLRQMALCIAAGCHPFTFRHIEPRNVLVIDAENSERQLRRALRGIYTQLKNEGYRLDPNNFRIVVRDEPLDLQTPADQRWVYEQVAAAKPDVLYIGPLYKLGAVGNDEEPAKAVIRVLDTIRARWAPCLLMETHSPHGDSMATRRPLRPIGASIWMRWPEFGYGLEKDKDQPDSHAWFASWRGPRDVREWPRKLQRGGKWLWQPIQH